MVGRSTITCEVWWQMFLTEPKVLRKTTSDAYQLLGHVFEKENEEALAMECYRKGLELSTKSPVHLTVDTQL